jgi:CheY-like chemotaxis protein
VLIIEDEPLVALDIENMLGENGCKTLGPANTVESALEHVALGGFDMALLDANLQGEGVDEVAEALTRSGASFAFVTGYGRDGLPEGFRQAPMVSKPFSEESLIACISEVILARTSKAGPATNPPVAI